MITAAIVPTPPAPLAILILDETVVAAGYTSPETLAARLRGSLADHDIVEGELPAAISEPLQQYLDGELDALDRVPLRAEGTEFQQAIWDGLRAVPAGETWSYAQLAQAAGRPAATRAAGTACGANLIAPFIPCHRAVRTDGSLGGYEYGLAVKQWLLGHERGQLDLGSQGSGQQA